MAAKSVSDKLFIKALPPSVVEAFRHSDYVPNDLKICMGNHPGPTDQLAGLKPGATANSTKHAKTRKAKTAESSSSGHVQSSAIDHSKSLEFAPQSPTRLPTAFLPGAQAHVDVFFPVRPSQNTTNLRDHVENIPAPLASTPDSHCPINIPDDYMPSEGDMRYIEQFLVTVAPDSSFST
ncbi:hypothetical protein AAF712_014733 [Marasmius tenuissimus]|uniref:Uncharacterized protein n=1 Tax=Marasmius tenuissimus TaxID=585030 RepID=A0ABR2ZDQ7_9AGAR